MGALAESSDIFGERRNFVIVKCALPAGHLVRQADRIAALLNRFDDRFIRDRRHHCAISEVAGMCMQFLSINTITATIFPVTFGTIT